MIDQQQQETQAVDTTTVGVFRTAATVKGGRRFSFSALVVAGDRHGSVGIGYAKGKEVPPSIEKAEKEARRSMKRVRLLRGTLPHTVTGRFGASIVRLVPASPGTGVVAGATVRAVLELAGVRDCLTKAYGSTNKMNLVKATLDGLEQLRSKEQVAALRGVEIEETRVETFLKRSPIDAAPVRKPAQKSGEARGMGRGQRGGGGGGGGGPRRGRGGGGGGRTAGPGPTTGGATETRATNPPATETTAQE